MLEARDVCGGATGRNGQSFEILAPVTTDS